MNNRALTIAALLVVVSILYLWRVRHYDFECPQCGHRFTPALTRFAASPHAFTKRLMRCPNCGVRDWCSPVPKREE